MIPTVLLDLITKYQNIGIFVYDGNYNIYLFDGKTWQFWCVYSGFYPKEILTYDNNICYIKNASGISYIYKNLKWQKAKNKNTMNIKINDKKEIEIAVFGEFILHEHNKESIRLPRKRNINSGDTLLSDGKKYLFYFSAYDNEKFDLETFKWSNFANPPYRCQQYTKLFFQFKDLFYMIYSDNECLEYNPITDTWKKLNEAFESL